MKFFVFLREKVLSYILLLCIIVTIIWSIVGLLASTYLWKTSELTLLVDEEVSAKIDISARIIYKDFSFFGIEYPFHIVFPFSRDIACAKECRFLDIPAGRATVVLTNKTGVQTRETFVVAPDTAWEIDLRESIRIVAVGLDDLEVEKWILVSAWIPDIGRAYSNNIQGLFLIYQNGTLFLYDTSFQQKILLPQAYQFLSVFRGVGVGEYYLVTNWDEVVFFDRYGQKKTEIVTRSTIKNMEIRWVKSGDDTMTYLTIGDKERSLFGYVFWYILGEKVYLFDKWKIFDIIK